MHLVIVTTEERCPAAFALRAEGYNPQITVVDPEDIYAYGRTLAEYWDRGEEFINIEHDMAPWEGALQALASCLIEDALCLFGYPRASTGSLGLTKFSKDLIKRFPKANERWPITPWNHLEQAVLGQFTNVPKHQHMPNVAHLSGWFTQGEK